MHTTDMYTYDKETDTFMLDGHPLGGTADPQWLANELNALLKKARHAYTAAAAVTVSSAYKARAESAEAKIKELEKTLADMVDHTYDYHRKAKAFDWLESQAANRVMNYLGFKVRVVPWLPDHVIILRDEAAIGKGQTLLLAVEEAAIKEQAQL